MLVKTLLRRCGTGFDLVIIADSTSGHTEEYSSVASALILAGDCRLIEWEVGVSEDREFILFITI